MKGKVAIVTGGASGIGRATAALLAKRGATVVIGDVDVELGEAAALAIGANAHFRKLDVGDERNWVEVVSFAQSELGGFNILVNNAGTPSFQSIADATVEEWTRVFRVNAMGPFLGCKHAVRVMSEKGGAIVNVSSNSSVIGMDSIPIYSSSKAAVNGLSMQIASDCRRHKLPIRCNTVVPGGTRSKMQREAFLDLAGIDTDIDTPEARAILADLADPELVANAIVFVASDDAARMNGAEIVVDGMQSRIFSGS
jgi:3(or 17)beta-hydroxysteroid dehydrogenase